MTYNQLLRWLNTLNAEQLDQDVTLYDREKGEYYPAVDKDLAVGTDVIDDGHPVIIF